MLSREELERYARHIVLRDVGGPGQAALKQARVLVIGAGGLGAPVLFYLAAAGVGTIGIVDDDLVSLSNLQRQVVHTTGDIGDAKVDSAAAAIARLNPHVAVERHAIRIAADNALELISQYDLVIDGSDNFATRYLVSDACYFAKRPLVTGAIGTFDAALTTLRAHERSPEGAPNPTYRCLFPEPPPPGLDSGLFGGRCARRIAGHCRLDDGAGGDPRNRGFRRGPGRAAADDRHPLDAVRDPELRLGPEQSAVGRSADDHGFVDPRETVSRIRLRFADPSCERSVRDHQSCGLVQLATVTAPFITDHFASSSEFGTSR